MLVVLALIEALSRQRLLFASLASSAFLIYLNPQHPANGVRTLALSQLGAALTGMGCFLLLGPGYLSAGTAMVLAIVAMVALDAVHPPAVSTALGFGLQSGNAGNIALFCLALGITVALLGLQRLTLWLVTRWDRQEPAPAVAYRN